MTYHSNFFFGAPLTRVGQERHKAAVLERFNGDYYKAWEFIEDSARLQIQKASGLLSSTSILAGLSYFTHSTAPLVLALLALLLALGGFFSKWPRDTIVITDLQADFDWTYHICINRCIGNALSTYLVFISVLLLAYRLIF